MTERKSDVLAAIERFHEDVPHQFQVSLTMSIDVRDDVTAIREELNDIAGGREVTTNDVMRLALIAAARYHSLATDKNTDIKAVDRDELVPLTAAISHIIDAERRLDPSEETHE